MATHNLLAAQVDDLGRQLWRAESVLGSVDDALRARVETRIRTVLSKQRSALKAVRDDLGRGPNSQACWDAYRRVRNDCGPVFRECLALLEGAAARNLGIDDGLCEMGDALLDDLSTRADIPWGRFTIVAEGEFFFNMAEIIRLRFPETGIWNLPIAAHEFGHFVAQELKIRNHDGSYRYPFRKMLERESRKHPRNGVLLHERFADAFAVYALGPAPIFASLVLRFDPGTADAEGEQHPAEEERVYSMLQALRLLDEGAPGSQARYGSLAGELEAMWRAGRADAGLAATPASGRADELDARIREFHDLFANELPRVKYTGWTRAQDVVEELRPELERPPHLEDDVRLADVLNAAWLCRHWYGDADPSEIRQIGEKATDACRFTMTVSARSRDR